MARVMDTRVTVTESQLWDAQTHLSEILAPAEDPAESCTDISIQYPTIQYNPIPYNYIYDNDTHYRLKKVAPALPVNSHCRGGLRA